MKLLDGPDFYGYTIFCDDIRNEVGGKGTFVGVYGEHLMVRGDFPVLLPKFGFGITCIQRAALFVPPSQILIFLPQDSDDAPSIIAEAPEEFGAKMIKARDEKAEVPHAIARVSTNFIASPLQLDKPGYIKVRVVRNNEMIRCGVLSVQKS